jgi:hypothetical protein
MDLRDFRLVSAGGASGSFFAWFLAGEPLRAATVVALYALVVGMVELVAYVLRHVRVRWERRA